MNEYKEDLKISFATLDENWRDQSTLYLKYAEMLAEKTAERDKAKEKLEFEEAKFEIEIRASSDPSVDFGIAKVTEATIKARVTIEPSMFNLRQNLTTLNIEVARLTAAKVAFEHRKKALEGLTQLFIAGYWSKPRLPKETIESDEKKSEELHKEQIKGITENTMKKLKKL